MQNEKAFCLNYSFCCQTKKTTNKRLPLNNQNIELETTRKELTHLTGLLFFTNLINRLNLVNRLSRFLPRMIRSSSKLPREKFLIGILAFICGADCIDDLNDLRDESFFRELTDGAIAPSTMRSFLGTFKLRHFEKLQGFLPVIAYELRKKLFPRSNKIIITMDATPHKQWGQYMEGVDWCYNKERGYITQNAFDENGLCYGWNLMSGNSHSHNGAVEMIERIFTNIPANQERYFRADSAYGSHKVYNALISHGVSFGICLSENVWGSLLDKNEFKIKWSKTKIRFFESSKCQIGSTIYSPKNLKGKSFLRVVYIRSKKKVIKKEDKRHYDYYAIITDMSEKEMNNEEVIRFYRGRANAENFIKDLKYGMDFKHFPCQSFNKNKAWGLMGIFAYNFMRYSSFLIDRRGCFLKRVRRKMVYLAGEIRKGQRKIKIRMNKKIFKEVKRLKEKIHLNFCSSGNYRLGRTGIWPPNFAL